VEVRSAAASNRFGTASFAHVHGVAEGWSGLKFRPHPAIDERDVEEITVPLEPIDDVVDRELAVRLIKIDVEGAEQQVIEGAMRTITTHHPTIVFEHGAGSADVFGTGPDDVWRLLVEEAGLRIFDLDGDGPYTRGDLRRNYYEAARVNFLAHA
jgi:Methyltransferase FkbM domain